jgi:hypothetical protein
MQWIATIVMATSTVCAAGSAQPRIEEHFIVNQIEIRLRGGCDTTGGEVWVILDGADREAYPATAEPGERCVWTATPAKPFDAKTRFVSVRFKGRRSDCKYAASLVVPRSKKMATYWFDWNDTPAWDVKVDVAPADVPVSYVRVVKRGLDPQDCVEQSPVLAGDLPVRSVSFDRETLRLQLGRKKPDVEFPGVPLDRVVSLEKLKREHRYQQVLSRTAVLDALAAARVQGGTSAPSTSGTALDIVRKQLVPFQTLTVTVE